MRRVFAALASALVLAGCGGRTIEGTWRTVESGIPETVNFKSGGKMTTDADYSLPGDQPRLIHVQFLGIWRVTGNIVYLQHTDVTFPTDIPEEWQSMFNRMKNSAIQDTISWIDNDHFVLSVPEMPGYPANSYNRVKS